MKKFLPLMLVMALLGTVSQVFAQAVYACEDYTTAGEPIGEGDVWNIEKEGGYVYLLYNNGGRKISDEMIFFFIDKKKGGTYEEYDTKTATPEKKPYALLDYKFTEAGEYKITIYNADVEELASTFITVKMKGSTTTTTTTTPKKSGSDTYYYSDAKIIFCEEVTDNEPVNEATSFTIPKAGGYLTVQVDNGKALKTTQLVVEVYKKPKGGSDYTEFVETKYYDIKETWDRPYFTYTFYKGGEYKLAVYTADEVWINSGYVTINQK